MDQIEIFIACFTGQRVEIDIAYQPRSEERRVGKEC